MIINVEISMPDDFLVATLTERERNEALARRLQSALDNEYPNARMGTVAIVELSSVRTTGEATTSCDECGAPTPRGNTNWHQCNACINTRVRGY